MKRCGAGVQDVKLLRRIVWCNHCYKIIYLWINHIASYRGFFPLKYQCIVDKRQVCAIFIPHLAILFISGVRPLVANTLSFVAECKNQKQPKFAKWVLLYQMLSLLN